MTQYTIFMHYYNDSIGHSITNETDCKWYSALTDEYNGNTLNNYLSTSDMDQSKLDRDKEVLESIYISDQNPTTAQNTSAYEDLILTSTDINNPKYDMLFIYDGLGYFNYKDQKWVTNKTTSFATETTLYFDKMKRVNIKPWFFHSTYTSLKAALNKAESLIDLYGKNNILIGKEVDLTQYIDII